MAKKKKHGPIDDLDETLTVLHREGRRRATLAVEEGGFDNLELIGFTKALVGIRVEAQSLLEDDSIDEEGEDD